eukprot:NODE_12173_length_239_cov_47.157895_g10403_i0.p1 GENE.NODE_12173_length_239_cov_47.157895_g10403_i0~~NODE_12173_length_239_cov_47.157895_g10403_i0.p1  ORF type:complete len:58 (+),score=25.56 NODE_12173_length_239_cov_47.157895_g10403_i0:32-175(+)
MGQEGDVVKGTISCRPNKGNHRDLDIKVSLDVTGKHPMQTKQDYRLR